MKVMFIVNSLGINEPLGPMILSSVLKQKGHDTILGDIQGEDVKSKILSWKPDVLACSMMSVDMKDFIKFNDDLRNDIKIFTILGGVHATLEPSCIQDPGIDAICVGEGEDAIIDVVESLEKGKSLEGIPNIKLSEDTPIKMRGLIHDLDTIPFMDRDLVYTYKPQRRFGIKSIWATRGCAYACPYCHNNQLKTLNKGLGRNVRIRSVDSIIRETKELIDNHYVKFIRIGDDMFPSRLNEWVQDFSTRWASEIKIPFYLQLRVELITPEFIECLKRGGLHSVSVSIECYDHQIRNKMLRRKISIDQIERGFKILKRYGVKSYCNTMLGLPFTSLEHDIASVDFNIRVKPDMPDFSIFMPYPGTDLGDYCRTAGIYKPTEENINYGFKTFSPLTCFTSKEKEVQHNLIELAIVALVFPRLRRLILNHLIYWKPNKVFFVIQYIFAVSVLGIVIFPFKRSPFEYVELVYRSFKHYLFDFMSKKLTKQTVEKENEVTVLNMESRRDELKKCLEAMSGRSRSATA